MFFKKMYAVFVNVFNQKQFYKFIKLYKWRIQYNKNKLYIILPIHTNQPIYNIYYFNLNYYGINHIKIQNINYIL